MRDVWAKAKDGTNRKRNSSEVQIVFILSPKRSELREVTYRYDELIGARQTALYLRHRDHHENMLSECLGELAVVGCALRFRINRTISVRATRSLAVVIGAKQRRQGYCDRGRHTKEFTSIILYSLKLTPSAIGTNRFYVNDSLLVSAQFYSLIPSQQPQLPTALTISVRLPFRTAKVAEYLATSQLSSRGGQTHVATCTKSTVISLAP